MTKKYSLSKNEIIVEEMSTIREVCANILSANMDLHLIDDLVQDVTLILLSQNEITIQSLHETNQFCFYVARIVTNQVLSTTSPFHKTYRLRLPKNGLKQDDYEPLADEIWVKAMNLPDDRAKSIVHLRYEYGLKIHEIAKIHKISTRYVHGIIASVHSYLEKNH